MLDALQELAARVFAQPLGDAVLLQLEQDVGAAGEIAQQHPLAVADRGGRDVLIGGRIAEHGADMHPALVREGGVADVG